MLILCPTPAVSIQGLFTSPHPVFFVTELAIYPSVSPVETVIAEALLHSRKEGTVTINAIKF